MKIPIRISDLGCEARFSGWFVSPGERVRDGERIAEVLIPGVAIDVVAPAAGVLTDGGRKRSEPLAAGDILGTIDTANEGA
jgi:pyruvate/2-oxoglutarate dehydrogenase complex dihydrolipoamide acyltransferase (E2) component